MFMGDDALLLQFLSDGSESAFTELVARHRSHIYSLARLQLGGDRHLAEDVSQRVFFELSRSASKLYAHQPLLPWLLATTRFIAAKVARTEYRRRRYESAAAEESNAYCSHRLSTEDQLDSDALRNRINQAL